MTDQVNFTAESPEGVALTDIVKSWITNLGLQVDADFVAQYVTVLVCNNKPPAEITNELVDIVGTTVSGEFAEQVYAEARRIQGGTQQQTAPVASAFPASHLGGGGSSGGSVATKHAEIAEDALPTRSAFPVSHLSGSRRRDRDSTRGAFKASGGVSKRSGPPTLGGHTIGKNGGAGNGRNADLLRESLRKDANGGSSDDKMGDADQNEAGTGSGPRLSKKQRCRHWPYCNYPECVFPHPSRDCKLYPDCPNPDGVCPFLHPSDPRPEQLPTPEEIEKYWERKREEFANKTRGNGRDFKGYKKPPTPALQLCKYAERCANKECVFGHPTPANDGAKVTVFEWCDNKENCADATCAKAHPSASLVRDPAPIPTHVLETCRYAWHCTNPRCRYRHPTSMVPCRAGPECQRVDCTFFHPIQEQCRFGTNCRNVQCLYLHPEGRDKALQGGASTTSWVKNEFTEDSQPMETVLPGSGDVAMEQA